MKHRRNQPLPHHRENIEQCFGVSRAGRIGAKMPIAAGTPFADPARAAEATSAKVSWANGYF